MSNEPIRRDAPADGILVQYALAESSNTYPDSVEFLINFKCDDGGDTFMIVRRLPQEVDDLSMQIDADYHVIMRLTRKNWKWSTQYQAVTTKFDQSPTPSYCNLRYKVGNSLLTFVQVASLNPKPLVRQIEFDITHRIGEVPSVDAFCWNVDFKVKGKPIWLPAMFDPEVINPKTYELVSVGALVEKFGDGAAEYAVFGYGDLGVEFFEA